MSSDLSVLVVDDDPMCLQMLQTILEETGLRVSTASRPTVALSHLEGDPPDILVTDLRMPEMSGLDVMRAAHAVNPETPCLVITGFASDEATAEAYRAGARDLLIKPINVAEVQARVRNAAEVVELRREVRALRAARRASNVPDSAEPSTPRARELADLPVLPGFAGPLDGSGWSDSLYRLERLGALYRQGIIEAAEFEEKKRSLLARL